MGIGIFNPGVGNYSATDPQTGGNVGPVGPITGMSIDTFLMQNPDAQVFTSVEAAHAAGNVVIQGNPQAVIPQADSTTNTVAPPVPGGLQMTGVLLVTTGQPVPGKNLP